MLITPRSSRSACLRPVGSLGAGPLVVVVVVVVDVAVVVVVVVGATPVHGVPLSVNDVGTPTLVPVVVPLKPNDTAPPVGIARFQSTLDAVTLAPEAANSAFQPCANRSAPGKSHTRRQPSTGSPTFLIVTLAENPPSHLFCTT